MRFRYSWLPAAVILASCATAQQPLKPSTNSNAPLRVGSIRVMTEPVFSEDEASRGRFYRAADLIAIQTTGLQVRQFLLLREGDEFDAAKMRESERNLRALPFVKTAAITASQPHDGVVDLTVATQDEFTTALNLDFSNDGGKSLYDIDLEQMNVFHTTAQIDLRTARLRERDTNSLQLSAPSLFGRHWSADAFAAHNSDGNEERLIVARPLFSYSTRSTLDSLADNLRQDSRVYANGVVQDLFAQRHRALRFLPGFAMASTPDATTRVLAGIDFVQDSFTPLQGVAPADRDFRFAEIGLDTTSFRFLTLKHVNLGMIEEDFSLGTHASLFAARTTDGVWRFTADTAYGHAFDAATFVTTRLSATTRAHAPNENAIVSSDTWFVKQWATAHPNTIVIRARFDAGRDVDHDVQFFADGQNGLRAYPNFAFAGTRRFVFNAEDRLYLGREMVELFEPALAAFTDVGTAANLSLVDQKLHADFGLGLRLGIARYQSAMLRFDLAYAATASPTSQRGLVFSFATSQAF